MKVFGTDLAVLESKGKEIKRVLEHVRGIEHVTLVQELGQPSLTVTVDRAKIARYGVNVADVNGVIEAAIGGGAATQVVQGEKLFDLVVRLEPRFRETPEQIGNILISTPGGQQIPLKELAEIRVVSGASFIYREDNSRFIGVQYSVEGRDLASAVEDARARGRGESPAAGGIPRRVGRRVQGVHGLPGTASGDPAADAVPDLPSALRALQQLQVPADHHGRRAPLRTRSAGCSRCA